MWIRNLFFSFIFIFAACANKPELILSTSSNEKSPSVQNQYFDLSQAYTQITTHPEIDAYPAISPNGQWLAFASRRSGNMDIWVKSVNGGPAFQITKHRSDDIMPAWSPDGKKLVYVSFSEDAAGDLWMISLREKYRELAPKGSPKKLTSYLGTDVSPSFSPNGKYVAFTSDRGGEKNTYVMKLKNGDVVQITNAGAIHPDWSPDGRRIAYVSFSANTERNGQIFWAEVGFESDKPRMIKEVTVTTGASNDAFPAWSHDGKAIIVTRYDRDTNDDGQINPDDQPNLWKIVIQKDDVVQENYSEMNNSTSPTDDAPLAFQEIQLLPSLYYDYQPVCSRDGKIYFISRRSGNEDIWIVDANGPVPRQNEGFLQYQLASSYFPLPETDLIFSKDNEHETREQLETRLIAFQRLNDFFPEENIWVGWALYEIARTYVELGQKSIAKTYFQEILNQFEDNNELVGKSSLKLFQLDFEISESQLKNQIQRLQHISTAHQDFQSIVAESEFIKGEVYFLAGHNSQALQIFQELIEKYPEQTGLGAQAQLLIGDIYAAFGQREEVINAYLKVVQNYPLEAVWTNIVLDKILSLQKYDESYSRIAGYRDILTQYKGYDRLLARTHLNIGNEFFLQNDYDAAIEELLLVETLYPSQREEAARSKLLASKVYQAKGEELMAISVYKNVMADYSDVQSGLYVVQAKEELLELYIKSGDRYRMTNDVRAANSRYRGAIQIMPGYIDAHRGLVATMYSLGEIDKATQYYEKVCIKNSDDVNMRYILGLCYSYKATETSDRTGSLEDFDIGVMKKSNVAIEEALSKNYRLIQAYLTLSFNYETIEKYERYNRLKQSGFVKSLIKTTFAPIKSIYYWLTFQKEKTPQRWFEEAIDVLVTAISLNDETQYPGLESELALNLASNYYNLQEFGFERAYHYYHLKLQYDSTFANPRSEAEIYKRMGHCALIVEDFQRGPKYLKKAIDLYTDLKDEQNKLINIKRLALLYQLAGETRGSDDFDESVEYEKSVDYFKMAAAMDEKAGRYNMLEVGYRSIAYNYQVLNDEDEAIRYAEKALDLIRQGKVEQVKAKPNWIKIGIMGIEFPVWNLGQIGAGASTAAEGFTTEEEIALLYSIIGNAKLTKRSIAGGISYLEKKLEIYSKRKDKLAQAVILNNIGYLYYVDFQYESAWENFKKSLVLCKKENNIPGSLANIYNLGRLGVLISNIHRLPSLVKNNTLQQSLVNRMPEYQAASMKYVHEGLKLIEEDEAIGFISEKMQLYNLLGNIHFFNNSIEVETAAQILQTVIEKQAEKFEEYAVADSCYLVSLDLALQMKQERFQITVRNNLGNLGIAVGDIKNGIEQFSAARELALKHNLSSFLWRIDFILGRILSGQTNSNSETHAMKDASFYFNEAISTLERDAYQFHQIRLSPFYLAQVRTLYELAIQNEIANGRIISGLRLTDQFHGKQFLDIIGSHNLQLKKERHKIYLGNARFLVEEIALLDKKIENAREKNKQSEPNYQKWLERKKQYEDEYQELLADIKKEDPELESFIHVEPVTFRQVQNILRPNSIIIDYFLTEQTIHIWIIDTDSVSYIHKEFPKNELAKAINTFSQSLEKSSLNSEIGGELYDILIQPVEIYIESNETIIVVTDGVLRKVPFSYFINFVGENQSDSKSVTTVPGLANYYFSFYKRKIKGSKLLVASNKYGEGNEFPGFNIMTLSDDNSNEKIFLNRLQQSDIIYLDVEFSRKNNDPLLSEITPEVTGKPFSLNLHELYKTDLVASVMVIDGVVEDAGLSCLSFEKAVMYAGSPSLVTALWRSDNTVFWSNYFDFLLDYPVAQALIKTQHKMKEQGMPVSSWAGFQIVGFEGMTNEQERQFAKESFMVTVNDASDDFQKEKWDDAAKKFEQALIMAKKESNQEAISDLYDIIIQSAARGGNYTKAIQYQLELVEKAEADNAVQQMIEGYNNLFVFYTNSENYERAIYFQNKYLELAKAYDAREEIAGSYYNLGLVHERQGDFEKALDYFGLALGSFDQLGDSLNVAQCYKDQGRIYLLRLDNYSKAIENQQVALDILQRQNIKEGTIEVLQNLGFSHERLGNYKASLKFQQEGFELAKELGNSKWIALSQHYMSNIYWKMGNYQQALNFQKQAMEIFIELKEVKLQVASLSTKGLILMSLGNLDDAENAEQRALDMALSIDDKQDMATIHKNLGLIYRSREKWDLAKQEFERATKIDEAIGFKRGLSYDYRDLGTIFVQQNDFEAALTYFRKGLQISSEIGDAQNQSQCLYEIARTHFLNNNIDAASDTLLLASSSAGRLFIPEVQWRAQRLIGQLNEKQNNLQGSIVAYTNALEIIETMRSQIKVEEFKSGFIDDKLVVYYELVNLYLNLDRPDKALEIVERAKSRNFIDMLANRDIDFSGDFNKQKFEQGKRLEDEINRIQNEISRMLVNEQNMNESEKMKLDDLNLQLVNTKNEYAEFVFELKRENPELAEMVQVEPLKTDSLRTFLPDSVMMVEYFYTEEKLYMWGVSKDRLVTANYPVQKSQLVDNINIFRDAIRSQRSVNTIARELYKILISPLKEELLGYRHLVIVPHGILHYLPFAALMDENQKYLIEKFSLSLAPSAMVLMVCLEKGQSYLNGEDWAAEILAFGNPDLGDEQFDLPFAEKEVESVELLYPNVDSYIRKDASETRFKFSSAKSNTMLLSCHGEFDAANPLMSSLLLAPDDSNDGMLQAQEIFSLRMDTYLIAMSACETGLATISVGDEVIGLSRSFIYAGASSLLSSLWKVDDLATAVMVKRLFRYLKEGKSRAHALQLAINFVRTNINVHPSYWAAFNLTGDFS